MTTLLRLVALIASNNFQMYLKPVLMPWPKLVLTPRSNSPFKENSFTTHHRNLQHLAILMYKVKNNLAPLPVQEIFRVYFRIIANNFLQNSSNVVVDLSYFRLGLS